MVLQLAFKLETRLVTKRTHAQIQNRLNEETMEKIRDDFWPKHFQNVPETSPGAGGYRYARRSARYERYKFKKYGHNLPLVLTGGLRSSVRSSATITSTANRATLRSHSPHFLRRRNKRELEIVSDREKKILAARYGERYVELANSPEYQEKRIRNPAAI
jgi:hypothetical protein